MPDHKSKFDYLFFPSSIKHPSIIDSDTRADIFEENTKMDTEIVLQRTAILLFLYKKESPSSERENIAIWTSLMFHVKKAIGEQRFMIQYLLHEVLYSEKKDELRHRILDTCKKFIEKEQAPRARMAAADMIECDNSLPEKLELEMLELGNSVLRQQSSDQLLNILAKRIVCRYSDDQKVIKEILSDSASGNSNEHIRLAWAAINRLPFKEAIFVAEEILAMIQKNNVLSETASAFCLRAIKRLLEAFRSTHEKYDKDTYEKGTIVLKKLRDELFSIPDSQENQAAALFYIAKHMYDQDRFIQAFECIAQAKKIPLAMESSRAKKIISSINYLYENIKAEMENLDMD